MNGLVKKVTIKNAITLGDGSEAILVHDSVDKTINSPYFSKLCKRISISKHFDLKLDGASASHV